MKHINKKQKEITKSEINTNSDANKSLISVSNKSDGKEDGSSYKKLLSIFILITFIMLIGATAYYQKTQPINDLKMPSMSASRLVVNRAFGVGNSFVYERKNDICFNIQSLNESKENCLTQETSHTFTLWSESTSPELLPALRYINAPEYKHKLSEIKNLENGKFLTFSIWLNKLTSKSNSIQKDNDIFESDPSSDSTLTNLVFFIMRDDGKIVSVFKPHSINEGIFNHIEYLIKEFSPRLNKNAYKINGSDSISKLKERLGDMTAEPEYFAKISKEEVLLQKTIDESSFFSTGKPKDSLFNSNSEHSFDSDGNLKSVNEVHSGIIKHGNKEGKLSHNDLLNENFEFIQGSFIPKDYYSEIKSTSSSQTVLKEAKSSSEIEGKELLLTLKKLLKKNYYSMTDKDKSNYSGASIEEIRKNFLEKRFPKGNYVIYNSDMTPEQAVNDIFRRKLEEADTEQEIKKPQMAYLPLFRVDKFGISGEVATNILIEIEKDVLIIKVIFISSNGVKDLVQTNIVLNMSGGIKSLFYKIKQSGKLIGSLVSALDKLLNTDILGQVKSVYTQLQGDNAMPGESADDIFSGNFKDVADYINQHFPETRDKLIAFLKSKLSLISNPLIRWKDTFVAKITQFLTKYIDIIKNAYNGLFDLANQKLNSLLDIINTTPGAVFFPDMLELINIGKEALKNKIEGTDFPKIRINFINQMSDKVKQIISQAKLTVIKVQDKINSSIDNLPFAELKETFDIVKEELKKVVDSIDSTLTDFNNLLNTYIPENGFDPLRQLSNTGFSLLETQINKVTNILKDKIANLPEKYQIYQQIYDVAKYVLKELRVLTTLGIEQKFDLSSVDEQVQGDMSNALNRTSNDFQGNFFKVIADLIINTKNNFRQIITLIKDSINRITTMYNKEGIISALRAGDIFKTIDSVLKSTEIDIIMERFEAQSQAGKKIVICSDVANGIKNTYESLKEKANSVFSRAEALDIEGLISLKEIPDKIKVIIDRLTPYIEIINEYITGDPDIIEISPDSFKIKVDEMYNIYKETIIDNYVLFKAEYEKYSTEWNTRFENFNAKLSQSYKIECNASSSLNEATDPNTKIISKNIPDNNCLIYDISIDDINAFDSFSDKPIADCLIPTTSGSARKEKVDSLSKLVSGPSDQIIDAIKSRYDSVESIIDENLNFVDRIHDLIKTIGGEELLNNLVNNWHLDEVLNDEFDINKGLPLKLINLLNEKIDIGLNFLSDKSSSLISFMYEKAIGLKKNNQRIPNLFFDIVKNLKFLLTEYKFSELLEKGVLNDISKKIDNIMKDFINKITSKVVVAFNSAYNHLESNLPKSARPPAIRLMREIKAKIDTKISNGKIFVETFTKKIKDDLFSKARKLIQDFQNTIKNKTASIEAEFSAIMDQETEESFDLLNIYNVVNSFTETIHTSTDNNTIANTIEKKIVSNASDSISSLISSIESIKNENDEAISILNSSSNDLLFEKKRTYEKLIKQYFYDADKNINPALRSFFEVDSGKFVGNIASAYKQLQTQFDPWVSVLSTLVIDMTGNTEVIVNQETIQKFDDLKNQLIAKYKNITQSKARFIIAKLNDKSNKIKDSLIQAFYEIIYFKGRGNGLSKELEKIGVTNFDSIINDLEQVAKSTINNISSNDKIINFLNDNKSRYENKVNSSLQNFINTITFTLNQARAKLIDRQNNPLKLSDSKLDQNLVSTFVNNGKIILDRAFDLNNNEFSNMINSIDETNLYSYDYSKIKDSISQAESLIPISFFRDTQALINRLSIEIENLEKKKYKEIANLASSFSYTISDSCIDSIKDESLRVLKRKKNLMFDGNRDAIHFIMKLVKDKIKKRAEEENLTSLHIISLVNVLLSKVIPPISKTFINVYDRFSTKYISNINTISYERITINLVSLVKDRVRDGYILEHIIEALSKNNISENLQSISTKVSEYATEVRESIMSELNKEAYDLENDIKSMYADLKNTLQSLKAESDEPISKIYIAIDVFNSAVENFNIDNFPEFNELISSSDEVQKEFFKTIMDDVIEGGLILIVSPLDKIIKEKLKWGHNLAVEKLVPLIQKYITSNLIKGKQKLLEFVKTISDKFTQYLAKAAQTLLKITAVTPAKRNLSFILNIGEEIKRDKFLRNLAENYETESFSVTGLFETLAKAKDVFTRFKSLINDIPEISKVIDFIKNLFRFIKNGACEFANQFPSKIGPIFLKFSKNKGIEYWNYIKDMVLSENSLLVKEYNKVYELVMSTPNDIKNIAFDSFFNQLSKLVADNRDHWANQVITSIVQKGLYEKSFPFNKNISQEYKFFAGPIPFTISFGVNIAFKLDVALKAKGPGFKLATSINTSIDAFGQGSVSDPSEMVKATAGIQADAVKFNGEIAINTNFLQISIGANMCMNLSVGRIKINLKVEIGKELIKKITSVMRETKEICEDVMDVLGQLLKKICKVFEVIGNILEQISEIVWIPSADILTLVDGYNLKKCFEFSKSFKQGRLLKELPYYK